jgi:hypothetical protein
LDLKEVLKISKRLLFVVRFYAVVVQNKTTNENKADCKIERIVSVQPVPKIDKTNIKIGYPAGE